MRFGSETWAGAQLESLNGSGGRKKHGRMEGKQKRAGDDHSMSVPVGKSATLHDIEQVDVDPGKSVA